MINVAFDYWAFNHIRTRNTSHLLYSQYSKRFKLLPHDMTFACYFLQSINSSLNLIKLALAN